MIYDIKRFYSNTQKCKSSHCYTAKWSQDLVAMGISERNACYIKANTAYTG